MGPRSTSIVELLNEVLDESNNSKKKKYPQALKTVTYISKILKYIHFWGKTKNNTYIWNTKTYFWGHVWCCRSAVRAFISHLPSLMYTYTNVCKYLQLFPNPNDIFHISIQTNLFEIFLKISVTVFGGFSDNIWNALEFSFENLIFEIL